MGYRNPRSYFIPDPTIGAKAFEESFKETFTEVDDYYTGLEETAQKKNQQVATELQKIQEELNKFNKLGSNGEKAIRQMVQMKIDELKSGVTTEEGGIFKRAFTAKVSGPTPQEMTKAINNAVDFGGSVNQLHNFASKFDESKLDKGNKYFKYVKPAINTLKENPDAINYYYKDGKMDFELKFNHPIHGEQILNRSVVSAMLDSVDKSSVNKSALDAMYKGRISAIEGKVKSYVSEKEKELKAGNQTGLVSAIDFTKERVSDEVENMEDERIESLYFNYSNVNDASKFAAFKNLDNVIASNINSQIDSKPEYLKKKANKSLMNLLNNPNSDEAVFQKEFGRLGLTNISKEDFLEAILDHRMAVVKESMIQDVISKGVISGVNVRRDRRAPSARSVASRTSGTSQDVSGYIKTKGETMRSVLDKVLKNPRDPFASAPQTKESAGLGFDDVFDSGPIQLSGPITRQDEKGSPMINSINFDPSTNKLYAAYDSGKVVGGEMQQLPGKEFNIYNPQELQAFWQSITPELDKGKAATSVLEGFKEEASKMFEGANIAKLEDERMGQWLKWYSKNAPDGKKKLIEHAAANPNLYSLTEKGVSHWVRFYQENKTAIDLAEMKK